MINVSPTDRMPFLCMMGLLGIMITICLVLALAMPVIPVGDVVCFVIGIIMVIACFVKNRKNPYAKS